METPKVFASYSHDSDDHKQWVLKLCTKLVENGVDVMLDQWDIRLGTDQTLFMEKLGAADRVLVICTDAYVKKADNRAGGVGYEGRIITTQIAENLKTDKFIPVIRQSLNEKKMPVFFGNSQYIDFTDDNRFDEKFNELLHDIHGVPITRRPPLGENPLPNQPLKSEDLSHNLREIPDRIESVADAYESALELARTDDILGWSRLVNRIRPNVFQSLVQWRQEELDGEREENIEQRHQVMDRAVDIVSPLISVALGGIKSGNEQFNNQASLLADLLNIQSMEGWNPFGYSPWIEIPYALGSVYHNLHGSFCLQINRLDLAFNLAQAEVPSAIDSQLTQSVWENRELMGYTKTLGGLPPDSWEYLSNAFERWEWLSFIFENDLEYRISLVAYHIALSIHELAARIASGGELSLARFKAPFEFLHEEYEIKQRAPLLLVENADLSRLWTCVGVTQDQMRSSWTTWISAQKNHPSYHEPCYSGEEPPNFVDLFRIYGPSY